MMAVEADEDSDSSGKIALVKQWLPEVLPELLICCKLSEADKRNLI